MKIRNFLSGKVGDIVLYFQFLRIMYKQVIIQ